MKSARLVAAIALGAIAFGAFGVNARPAPKPAKPTPQELVAARQAGFAMSAAVMGGISAAVKAGAPAKSQVFAARGMAKWSAAMPALFAASTRGIGPSRAKAEIWTNRADFAAKAADYAKATEALAAAAAADDSAALSAALASTGAACKACHDSYQAPPPAPKAG